MRLRTAFEVDDDLQRYAEAFLFARAGCLATGGEVRDIGSAQFAVLAREAPYQVEMGIVRGGELIPDHVHPHADTIEIGVAGGVRLKVNGADPFAAVPDERLAAFTRRRGIRINRCDWHGGQVLAGGAVFLSVQRWIGPPSSVIVDFER